ncbi:MAG: right-handed parallel beta-helix repeat-containing protein [Planctomycetota bacterium]
MNAQILRSPQRRSPHRIAGLIAILVGLAGGAFAQTTIYVDCSNPDCANADGSQASPFCTIQEGIDAATDGDTVVVGACTYNENIDFSGKTIALISASGADVTIIDGGNSDTVVRIIGSEGPATLLEGFTITNGRAVNGGGILIAGTAAPTIRNSTITGNRGTPYGGGVSCIDSSSPTLELNTITSNSADYSGGGIDFRSTGSGLLLSNTVSGNSIDTGNGGGIYSTLSSTLTISGGTITLNSASRNGGGVCAYGSLDISDATLMSNSADEGGGGIQSGKALTMSRCRVESNTSGQVGGGVSFQAGTITDSLIRNNVSSGGGGVRISGFNNTATLINTLIADNSAEEAGGIFSNEANLLIVSNCTLANNAATTYGGIRGTLELSNSIVWGNVPDQLNGSGSASFCNVQGDYTGTGNIDADPLFEDPVAGDFHLSLGSPCVNTGNNSDPNLQDTDFEGDARIIEGIVDMGVDEFACAGVPAFLFVDASNASCPGSGTELDPYCTIQMAIDNSCSGDTITVGPGTYVENLDLKGRDLILRSTAGAHETILNGSGIGPVIRFEYGADTTLEGFTLRDGLHANGGGIVCRNSSPTLINCVVTDCQALLNGGAMYCQSADPTLINVTFTQNVAGALGGAIYSTGSSAVVATNSILWGNTPDAVSGDPATITFSDVEGGYIGSGNIDLDPELLDPANGDFRLSCASPCIDAGTDAVSLLATDFEGDPRQVDGDSDGTSQPDMGADEFDELFIFFDVLGDLTGFLAQAPPASTGASGFVLISMGNGASGGIPLPYGDVIGLDLDPLLNGWLLAIPSVFRTVTVQGCPGTATGLLEVPSGFSGFSGYYAGFFSDGATSFRATPTKRFVLP